VIKDSDEDPNYGIASTYAKTKSKNHDRRIKNSSFAKIHSPTLKDWDVTRPIKMPKSKVFINKI